MKLTQGLSEEEKEYHSVATELVGGKLRHPQPHRHALHRYESKKSGEDNHYEWPDVGEKFLRLLEGGYA